MISYDHFTRIQKVRSPKSEVPLYLDYFGRRSFESKFAGNSYVYVPTSELPFQNFHIRVTTTVRSKELGLYLLSVFTKWGATIPHIPHTVPDTTYVPYTEFAESPIPYQSS
jgi:hypothetical protein